MDRRAILPVMLLALALAAAGCNRSSGGSAYTREQYRAAATALYQQQLYQEAADLYEDYLRSPVIAPEDVPKVLYQVGTIYQENLLNPKAALARYTLLKAAHPGETFGNQLGKRMVACLEAMGRSVDAVQARSRITDFNPDTSAARPGEGAVVAELDGRKITLGEIKTMVGRLPEAPLEVNQLVREYVAHILIAEAARRKGIADKAEVRLRVSQAETQILAQAALAEELKVPAPTGNDLKYYFEANKARYASGADSAATLESAGPRVRADWAREKQGAEYQRYVERLLQTAKVNFFSAPSGSAASGSPAPAP
jgi:hypothetical protein